MDLDGDGRQDILSGSWPGELYLFRGQSEGKFAAPEMIRDKDGEIINVGGGVQKQSSGSILIRGRAEFKETPEGTVVTYRGKEYKSTPDKPVMVTGTASAAHAADWDDDGDYDLLVGDIRGNLYFVPNEGTSSKYAFGKEQSLKADGRPINVAGGDAGPFAADWDDDGDLDLLVGAGDGSVSLFQNVGTRSEPKLEQTEQLVSPGDASFGADAPKEPCRGIRSKICAADWNGDGRLDLLVGDFTTQRPDQPELTAEQRAEHEKIRDELEDLQNRFQELYGKLRGPNRVRDEDAYKKLNQEVKDVLEKMRPLRSKLPRDYDTHGWVWLFLRKPAEIAAQQ